MAIQIVNLAVPNGDTPRSANTKINANFSDQTHAASRLVGTNAGQVPIFKTNGATGTPTIEGTGWGGVQGQTIFTTTNDVLTNLLAGGSRVFRNSVLTSINDSFATGIYCTAVDSYFSMAVSYAGNKIIVASGLKSAGAEGVKIQELYSNKNTTKDANGFIKGASPIVKVFADKVELSDEAVDQDVSYKKNGIGDYTITTASGLSTDGWYIELPKDMNGNPKVAVTLSEVDGVISLKTYKRIFSMETFTFEPDLDNPLDIPDGRWIDLRLNEIPVEIEDDIQTEV